MLAEQLCLQLPVPPVYVEYFLPRVLSRVAGYRELSRRLSEEHPKLCPGWAVTLVSVVLALG